MKRKWHSQTCDCGAKGPRFDPRTVPPLYGQNLETCTSSERIGKKNSEAYGVRFPAQV